MVLLVVQFHLLAIRQRAAVVLAHVVLLGLQPGLLALEPNGLARRELAALHALRDALLLMFLPLVDAGREHRRRNEKRAGDDCCDCLFHGESPFTTSDARGVSRAYVRM